jgi:hypothetical protein
MWRTLEEPVSSIAVDISLENWSENITVTPSHTRVLEYSDQNFTISQPLPNFRPRNNIIRMLPRLMQRPIRDPLIISPIKPPRIHTSLHTPRPIPLHTQTNTLRIELRTNRRLRPITHRQMRLMQRYDLRAQHIFPSFQFHRDSDVPTTIVLQQLIRSPISLLDTIVNPSLFGDLDEFERSCVDGAAGPVTRSEVG